MAFDDYEDWRPPPLPAGWELIAKADRAQFESELASELSPGHPLHGVRVIAVARCVGCDHTLFATVDEEWAIVHLTHRRAPESPPWPTTSIYAGRLPYDELQAHAH